MTKLDITRTITIDASASDTWDVVVDGFENTYTYLTHVAHGEPVTDAGPYGLANSKGVTGRLVWPQGGPGPVTERFTELNKDEWKMTHDVDGMPSAMGFKKGTVFTSWYLKELGANRCELELRMFADMYVFPGVIFKPLFTNVAFGPVLQKTVEDVKYYVENGTPSPPKLEALKKHPHKVPKNSHQEQAKQ